MNIHLDCFPCYYRQAIQAARFSTDDPELHWKAVRAVSEYLQTVSPDTNSIIVAENVHERIKQALNDLDPYKKAKDYFTESAEKMEPLISELAKEGGDPLLTAVKISIAGNVIDYGAGGTFDVESAIREALDYNFTINHYDDFKKAVGAAKIVLYIGDNTGELYFDKPLLRLLKGKDITFVTRGGPSLNDATIEYAERAGLAEFSRLADTGLVSMGFPLNRIRPEICNLFNSADIVIAKGQANFESLHGDIRPSLFFLMKVKCALVAKMLGAFLGDILVMESGRFTIHEI